ncbi:MAG TPA: 2-C-methyl-D-erythritol 4-phosphate cytidylyltransferase [Pyrinomonadaceae bacterium]|jgi:2-C-methyl-D-erythritol 4-phosphate cytidylyltransferase
MNVAIIVAGGSGTRFGGEIPKQFVEICGKPLVAHTLDAFENCSSIDEIVLVLPAVELENFRKKNNSIKLKTIVAGGKTRAESVFNGLQAVSGKAEIVAVHDGARPLVSAEEISRTIEMAKETGAACLVAPVSDTIKKVSGGKIIETVDRENLRRALTPQAFRLEILQKAFDAADLSEAATDECFLVEKAGFEIATVEGSAKNIKITTREDLIWAEVFLREKSDNGCQMLESGFFSKI